MSRRRRYQLRWFELLFMTLASLGVDFWVWPYTWMHLIFAPESFLLPYMVGTYFLTMFICLGLVRALGKGVGAVRRRLRRTVETGR